jgi:putative addiction module CopG family antidote
MVLKVTPDLEAKIDAMVTAGRFPSAEAVLRTAMQLLEDRERSEARLLDLIRVGEEQAAQGKLVDFDEHFIKRLSAEADERSQLGLPVKDEVKP